jgi:hypothetical protein
MLTRRKWLSAAGLLAIAGCAGQSAEEPIWVGHIGPVGARGESAIDGMQQMLADLREDEITVAGRSVGVRHVEAKDKGRARAEASRLLAVNRVVCLIVGPGVEGVADAIGTARSHGVAVVVLDGTADRALADQAVWLGTDPETQGEMLARYAIAKGERAYSESLPGQTEVFRGFERVFVAKGGKLLGSVLEGGRPRAGRVVLNASQGRPPSLTLDRTNPRPEPGVPNVPDREVWTLRMQPDPTGLPADGKAWAERYEKRFGKRPDDDAILGADAIALIADGLKTIKGDDRQRLAAEIAGRTEIVGLTGPIVRKDGRTRRSMWVERTVKGKRVGMEAVPLVRSSSPPPFLPPLDPLC